MQNTKKQLTVDPSKQVTRIPVTVKLMFSCISVDMTGVLYKNFTKQQTQKTVTGRFASWSPDVFVS